MNATTQRRRSFSPRAKRVLAAVLLLVLVLVPLVAVGVGAWFAHRHYDDAISKLTRQLKSQTAMNATRPQLMQAVEALRTKDTNRFFLKAGTPGLVAAEFQESLRSLIEANGGRVNQSQPMASKDADGYRQIGVSFNVSANNLNLQKLLYAIEQKEPYVFIDSLRVNSTGYGVRPAGQPEPEHLLQLDLVGYAPIVVEPPLTPTAAAGKSGAPSTAPGQNAAKTGAKP
jgi:general secretion pathway protein M